jgi:hypothetical protein
MDSQEHHEMVLETTHPSGAEEWYCPSCGRRFLMQWPPTYQKIVIEAGDEHAIHSGNKGGLFIGCHITPTETTPTVEEPREDVGAISSPESGDDENAPLADELRPWLRWMRDAGLDDRLDETGQ